MFYEWAVLTLSAPYPCGVVHAGNESPALEAAGAFLRDGRADLAVVAECWPAGQVWVGRRDHSGCVRWRLRT